MKTETLLPLGKLDPGLAAPEVPLDPSLVGEQATVADEVGYSSLLMEETKDDPFQILAVAATHTQRVKVGTSVSIAFARSPYVTAMSAWTLQKISNGRFELGLGSQVRGHIRRRFGLEWHAPGPWMRDYVRAVKAIWHSWQTQTPLAFESEHYNLNLNVPLFTPAPIEHPEIPIQVAAVNPYMCRVAAEVADGVRLHPVCSARYIRDSVVPVLEQHLSPGKTFDVCLKPLIATAPDNELLEKRKNIARQRLAFYISTPAYRLPFEAAGLGDLAEELSQLSRRGQWDQMTARVDDEVLQEWVVIALYDDLASEINRRFAGTLQRVEVGIPVDSQADQETLASILEDITHPSIT